MPLTHRVGGCVCGVLALPRGERALEGGKVGTLLWRGVETSTDTITDGGDVGEAAAGLVER